VVVEDVVNSKAVELVQLLHLHLIKVVVDAVVKEDAEAVWAVVWVAAWMAAWAEEWAVVWTAEWAAAEWAAAAWAAAAVAAVAAVAWVVETGIQAVAVGLRKANVVKILIS
jgi:kynurenine formamidase